MSAPSTTDPGVIQLVTFRLGSAEFGVDVTRTLEILQPVRITRVPRAAPHVLGILNLRGKILPVADPRLLLAIPGDPPRPESRIIVCELKDGAVVGIWVDRVREILRLDRRLVGPPPEATLGIERGVILGLAKLERRVVVILDVDYLLRGPERTAHAGR